MQLENQNNQVVVVIPQFTEGAQFIINILGLPEGMLYNKHSISYNIFVFWVSFCLLLFISLLVYTIHALTYPPRRTNHQQCDEPMPRNDFNNRRIRFWRYPRIPPDR